MTGKTISKRESSALIQSLTAGVVPRVGLRHIAVGRQNEVEAILRDLETIEQGGASFRLIAGRYGSGKSFLLQMIRGYAMERNFIVADVDLSPERRLTGTKGQGLATYRELMQNMSMMTRPDGGALEPLLQKWIQTLQMDLIREGALGPNDPRLVEEIDSKIYTVLADLSELTHGFAFSTVVSAYWRGHKAGDEQGKQNALRWLRGEYATKTEARKELGVDCIIDDQSWYEFLKLFALFICKMGYKGLVLFIDEGVNLYKISNRQARENNYEKVLTMFNDTMQGKAQSLGILLSGTEQFVDDERRGLFSYEALRSRLAENRFSSQGYVDYTSPVIRLQQLTPEEIYLLLERLCELHGSHYGYTCNLDESDLSAFLSSVVSRLGADELLTPREVTRDFLGLLNILHQNPDATFAGLMADEQFAVKPAEADPEELTTDGAEDIFAEFDI